MRKINIILTILLLCIGMASIVGSIRNPSAVYCGSMGYEYRIEKVLEGDKGICVLPNGEGVSSWEFLRGEVGNEHSYCERNGYELKVINDSEKCSSIFSYSCAVCVKGGEEVEVTKLMDLDFREGVCGDGICIIEEDHGICPEDCPASIADGNCDSVIDEKCDPDCRPGEDPDCRYDPIEKFRKKAAYLWVIIPIVLFLGLFFVFMIRRKRHAF